MSTNFPSEVSRQFLPEIIAAQCAAKTDAAPKVVRIEGLSDHAISLLAGICKYLGCSSFNGDSQVSTTRIQVDIADYEKVRGAVKSAVKQATERERENCLLILRTLQCEGSYNDKKQPVITFRADPIAAIKAPRDYCE